MNNSNGPRIGPATLQRLRAQAGVHAPLRRDDESRLFGWAIAGGVIVGYLSLIYVAVMFLAGGAK